MNLIDFKLKIIQFGFKIEPHKDFFGYYVHEKYNMKFGYGRRNTIDGINGFYLYMKDNQIIFEKKYEMFVESITLENILSDIYKIIVSDYRPKRIKDIFDSV